jgi:hypothetical protein
MKFISQFVQVFKLERTRLCERTDLVESLHLHRLLGLYRSTAQPGDLTVTLLTNLSGPHPRIYADVDGVPTVTITLCRRMVLCRRPPSSQRCLWQRPICVDGLFAGLPRTHYVPTAPINCRRHKFGPSAPCGFPVVPICLSCSRTSYYRFRLRLLHNPPLLMLYKQTNITNHKLMKNWSPVLSGFIYPSYCPNLWLEVSN